MKPDNKGEWTIFHGQSDTPDYRRSKVQVRQEWSTNNKPSDPTYQRLFMSIEEQKLPSLEIGDDPDLTDDKECIQHRISSGDLHIETATEMSDYMQTNAWLQCM